MAMPITEMERTDLGLIQIAPEVVEVIAGLATVEIEGVAGMSGGLAGGIADMLGRKNPSKGVRVNLDGSLAVIDVSIIVEYGVPIPELAATIQRNVKTAIETMTGLEVEAVHVNVHDMFFPPSGKEDDRLSAGQRVK